MPTDAQIDAYDSALLGILQQEDSIARFLDVVMGFLYRRTDFFHVMKDRNEKLGFPPGIAPKTLIEAYERYEELSKKRDITQEQRTIVPARRENSRAAVTKSKALHPSPAMLPELVQPRRSKQVDSQTSDATSSESSRKQMPDKTAQQKEFQNNPESHNGAVRENYRWAQTISDCDLRINVPSDILKGKQLSVTIQRKHITVKHLKPVGAVTVIDEDLSWEVRADECMWSLIPGDCVHINLEKVAERWWENVFIKEEKINTRAIDAVVNMTDMDDGAQSVVNKMMFDERQKQMGLPTSDQMKTEDILKKAWNADGSPFKGQPYDQNQFNIHGGTS